MAAGFSLAASRVPELINILCQHFKTRLAEQNLAKTMKIDSALLLSELGFEFIERLERLAPFGIGNATPLFVAGPLKIRSWRTLGQDGKHLKIFLSQETTIGGIKIPINNKTYEALLWNRAEEFLNYVSSGQQDIAAVFSVRVSEYQGDRSLQLEIKDWKAVSEADTELFSRFSRHCFA
jgi:single-stranded-DNA-specific exonuclease